MSNKRTIGEIIRGEVPPWPKNCVGVEIEIENADCILRVAADLRGFWDLVPDGSLRDNGIELRSPVPVTQTRLHQALRKLTEVPGIKDVRVSSRCSLHVHLNFLKNTEEDIIRFFLVWCALEEVLLDFSGSRGTNNYCTSMAEAYAVYSAELMKAWMNLSVGRRGLYQSRLIRAESKYSAVSASRLFDIGTLEIRCHEGTKDFHQIEAWVNVLFNIKAYAMNGTVQELLASFDCELDELYPQFFPGQLPGGLKGDRLRDSYRKGFYRAQNLLSGFKLEPNELFWQDEGVHEGADDPQPLAERAAIRQQARRLAQRRRPEPLQRDAWEPQNEEEAPDEEWNDE